MLLKVIYKNLFSFEEQTEFNLYSGSKSKSLPHHLTSCGHANVVRYSAIYGANGAGKSNLIFGLNFLKDLILRGSLVKGDYSLYRFKFKKEGEEAFSSIAIEFYVGSVIYYYALSFNDDTVVSEELYEVGVTKDRLIFSRSVVDGVQSVNFTPKFSAKNKKNEMFVELLRDKFLGLDELLLTLMATKYSEDLVSISSAYSWFEEKLNVLSPMSMMSRLAHMLENNSDMMDLSNILLPELKTGVNKLRVAVENVNENDPNLSKEMVGNIKKLKVNPEALIYIEGGHRESKIMINDNGVILTKKIVPIHKLVDGHEEELPLFYESDGTHRLINLMPMIYDLIHNDSVYVVDEIERSVHPILIKEIMSKLAKDIGIKGQLIFSTHESCLLDNSIFRTDEIWFAEKDLSLATRLYPLSDFNVHNTASVENGYLNGRYGAIPFLSNLRDLNWYGDE